MLYHQSQLRVILNSDAFLANQSYYPKSTSLSKYAISCLKAKSFIHSRHIGLANGIMGGRRHWHPGRCPFNPREQPGRAKHAQSCFQPKLSKILTTQQQSLDTRPDFRIVG
jgi:hypothetical protein